MAYIHKQNMHLQMHNHFSTSATWMITTINKRRAATAANTYTVIAVCGFTGMNRVQQYYACARSAGTSPCLCHILTIAP